MASVVQTVLGPVTPGELGVTYPHEHVLTRPPLWRLKEDPDFLLDSKEAIIRELELFKKAGGQTLVDATCLDYGRDAAGMVAVAKATGINIIAVTGFNRGDYGDPWVREASPEKLAELMARDLLDGMDGTSARAALIKVGTSYNVFLEVEERFLTAAGLAHRQTGAPVMTHTTRGTMGIEQVETLSRYGVDPSRIALSHLDQNLDFWYLKKIAASGAYVMFDGPSKVKYGPDSARVEMLKRLTDAGFARRILISGDMGRRSYLRGYGGGPGFEYILGQFVPRLREEGFEESLLNEFFTNNPRRYLSGEVS